MIDAVNQLWKLVPVSVNATVCPFVAGFGVIEEMLSVQLEDADIVSDTVLLLFPVDLSMAHIV